MQKIKRDVLFLSSDCSLHCPLEIHDLNLYYFTLQEAGFTFVELNASDKRSKRSLKEEVAEALHNHTLMDYFGEDLMIE